MKAGKQLKLDIIGLLNLNKISVDEARQALNVSERTVFRYLDVFRAKGPSFVFHGNCGKAPVNKTSPDDLQSAARLMKEKYFDFNVTHALEKLSKDDGLKINRETFRKVCHLEGMVKRAQRRKSKVRKARDRITQEGVMLQMDGSPHRWFGGEESCLIGVIDDATSEVWGAEFFESETTMGCMKVLKAVIEKKGLFNILYTDKAGIFGGQKRVSFSQVRRALSELGINIIFANSAQAKGRIERLWGTLQDRLVPEMRLRKIKSQESANEFLSDQYLENDHNKKFKVLARNLEPAWRAVPGTIDLNEIFCIKERRSVKNDHTYSFEGRLYKITSELKHSIQNQKIEIRTYLDGSQKVFFANRELEVSQHHLQPQISGVEKLKIIITEKDAVTVRKDSHIEYCGGFYSVDESYIEKKVIVRERENVVLIYHRSQLIETHQKLLKGLRQSSTKPEHLGPWQKTLLPGSIYRKAASQIGPWCDKLIFAILQRGQGVVDNKSIWGIISYKKSYQRQSLEEACKLAYEIGTTNYRGVSTVLNLRYKKKIASGQ